MILGSDKLNMDSLNPGISIRRIVCSECRKVLGTAVFPKSAPAQILPFMVSDDAYNGEDITYTTLFHFDTKEYVKHQSLCPECWEKSKGVNNNGNREVP